VGNVANLFKRGEDVVDVLDFRKGFKSLKLCSSYEKEFERILSLLFIFTPE